MDPLVRIINLPTSTFIARYLIACPLAKDAIRELVTGKVKTGCCPLSGAHLTVRRRGFMMRVIVVGYEHDGADAEKTARLLTVGR